MSNQPRKLYEIQAERDSRRKTQDILKSPELSSTLKSIGGGAISGGAFPATLAALGVVGNLPSTHRRLAEEPQIQKILSAIGGQAQVPQDVESAREFFEALSDKERKTLLGWAEKTKFNPGAARAVPATELLGNVARTLKKIALPPAAAGAALGALVGLGANIRKRREAQSLLEEAGLRKKASVDDRSMNLRGRLVIQSMFSELEKIAQAPMGMDPQAGMLAGGVQQGPSPTPSEEVPVESAPAHGVVASRINQLTPKRAIGIPVIQPPPGYVYSPELAGFVPNEQDPGWMSQMQAIEAARNKGWYDQGQQDVATQQAQAELDSRASAGIQQAQQEQMQMQQMAQMQQAAQQQAMMAEAQRQGRINADMKSGIVPQPSRGGPPRRKSAKGAPGGRGVTIQLGR